MKKWLLLSAVLILLCGCASNRKIKTLEARIAELEKNQRIEIKFGEPDELDWKTEMRH